MSEAGMLIKGEFYPALSDPKLGDAPLIEQVTGITFEEWADRFDRMARTGEPDTVALLGGVAMVVKRHHPGWSRPRVVQFMESLGPNDIESVGGEDSPPEEPAETPEPASPVSSDESTTTADISAEGAPV